MQFNKISITENMWLIKLNIQVFFHYFWYVSLFLLLQSLQINRNEHMPAFVFVNQTF